MNQSSKDILKIVERELLKFGSYENARKVLSKYMIGSDYDKDMIEKIFVIFSSEFRHEIEKIRNNLPEDDVEAEAAVGRKISYSKSRGGSSSSDDCVDEIVDEDSL